MEKHPQSESLLILKAKLLKDLRRYSEATTTLNEVLKINPKLSDARAMRETLKGLSSKNQIGVTYDFVYFDERFDDPWHLASIDYGRQTKIGTIIGRVNYTNRFKTDGVQLVMDAYPSISNTFYAYLSAGIAKKDGIFPRYRAGASLYANLPKSFEASVGFRLLSFTDETWVYTASLGKYYSNFWFNLRTYITPSNNRVSHSYSLTTRYYLAGADDYLSLSIGTGLSPDDESNTILFDDSTVNRLKSNNISVGYRKSFNTTNIIFIEAELEDQEYGQDQRGNQYSIGIGYNKRF